MASLGIPTTKNNRRKGIEIVLSLMLLFTYLFSASDKFFESVARLQEFAA